MENDNIEKSNNSSFEDLSNLNENELKEASEHAAAAEEKAEPSTSTAAAVADDLLDIIGNGQLTKKVLVKGNPDIQPQRGDICKVNYIGKLENGTIVEDCKDLLVQVGDVEIVQGLDMALPLMHLGEKAIVYADARFAYGSLGYKNEKDLSTTIPPCAKIIYEIELLECKDEEEIVEQNFEARKANGCKKRERGNFWYLRTEYNLAIQLYRRALEYLNDNGPGIEITSDKDITNSQLQELLEIRMIVYNNLAAAQMKISAYDTALTSVDNVLRCQPENVKALFRKGKILESKGDTNAAIPVLQKAATLDQESKAIQQLLSKCILKSRREARNEKDLYQKMLGHAQKLEENKRTKNNSNEVPKLKLWGYLMGSILIGVAGVAMYRYKYF